MNLSFDGLDGDVRVSPPGMDRYLANASRAFKYVFTVARLLFAASSERPHDGRKAGRE